MKKQRGYTLVEMVISIAVGMVIIAAIYAAVNMGQRSTVNVERKVAAHQDARASLGLMALEIEMASFNPTYASGVWVAPGDCTPGSGNQNYRGIQDATVISMTVESDINENGVIGGTGNPNEVITYAYDSTNQYITRSTNCSGGGNQPFLGDIPTSGNPRTVRVINTDAVPVFQYFDAQGTQITAAGLPAGIPNIARIDITLWVETEDVDPNSGQRRRMVYSTSVIPRNHVIKD
jgi:prepilin-type N-terminal cleavage/methylation domain-containing protein